jgi:hypothetical protein
MRHGQIARNSAQKLLAIVALALAGACADSVSAPTSEVSVKAKAPAAYNIVIGVTTFVYSPWTGVTQRLGDHLIEIPAGAICDPLTSGYGQAFWDAPCTAVSHPITITATTFADIDGHPYVDFEPALRFVPTKEVNLYLRDGRRPKGYQLAIWYCAVDGICVNEADTDPSLETSRVGKIFSRRLKHFSGYNIVPGGECNGTVEQTEDGSLYCNTSGMMSRSGYILASGLNQEGGSGTIGRRKKKAEQ